MKRLFLIVGMLVIGCSENPMYSEFVEDCECDLNISSTLPYSDGSYKLEFNADLAQTYTMLDASTNCGWSQHLSWQSDYEYRIENDWVNLVNPSSMTDENGNAHVMFAAWENFIDYTVAVYCGYTDDDGHHYMDTLYIEIVDNE